GGGGMASYGYNSQGIVAGGYTIARGVVIENAIGGDGNDKLTGNAANNRLEGWGGRDDIDGKEGADTMIGGSGDDSYYVDDSGDMVVELGGGGNDLVRTWLDDYTLPENVENLILWGEALQVNATGNSLGNMIYGTIRANVLKGGGGADRLDGSFGDDRLVVSDLSFVMADGGPGIDTLALDGAGFVLDLTNPAMRAKLSSIERIDLTGTGDNTLRIDKAAVNGLAESRVMVVERDRGDVVQFGDPGWSSTGLAIDGDGIFERWVSGTSAVLVEQDAPAVGVTIVGTAGDDIVSRTVTVAGQPRATNLGDIIDGGAGNDSLDGGGGDDRLYGGDGNDILIGGTATAGGSNQLWGGTGSDTASYAGRSGAVHADLGAQAGYVDGVLVDQMNSIENLTGGSGNDVLVGDAGNNVLVGGAGADTMAGGLGDDTYVVNVDGDIANVNGDVATEGVNEGTDTVETWFGWTLGANFEQLRLLGTNHFSGTGNDLNNALFGNAGRNYLDGGAGADTMSGGLDDDTYIVDQSDDVVVEAAGGGTDLARSSVSYQLSANVENLVLTGGASISGFGNDLANVLDGNSGSNVLFGGDGADSLSGGDSADYLLIDAADTGIAGGAGFDSAFVQTGAAVTLDMGTASIEWVQGNAGGDTFNASSQTGAVYIYGQGGDDTLTGSAFGDYIDGGDGTDTLEGGGGADLMLGNGGSDILRGQGGDDSLIELGGDSVIDGGTGFDSLFVWSDTGFTLNLTTASIEWVQGSVLGDDNLNGAGNTVNTFLYGWGGADVLTGGLGDDYIAGGTGDDVLTGGAGHDTMIGEAGFDRYVYTAATWGSDTIHSFDFNGEKLDFTAVAAIDSFADFTAYEWDPLGLGYNSTTLFYTNGGTTSAITLIGVQTASLSDADFLFA
ncbi:MAG: M10 family metallopeptidase C-terminal domain-containing protein, partial [Pseudomonadota bacterium]